MCAGDNGPDTLTLPSKGLRPEGSPHYDHTAIVPLFTMSHDIQWGDHLLIDLSDSQRASCDEGTEGGRGRWRCMWARRGHVRPSG